MTTAADPSPPPSRLAYLDGVRGVLALFVVVHHVYMSFWPSTQSAPAPHASLEFLAWGRHAVDAFIVVSGFSLTLPLVRHGHRLRGGAMDFYRRRARRVVPPFYFAVALSAAMGFAFLHDRTGTVWDATLPLDRIGILANVLLVQDVWQTHSVNYAFWSIATECRIYLFFPLIILVARRAGPRRTLLTLVIAFWAAAAWMDRAGVTLQVWTCVAYASLFCAGALAADFAASESRPPTLRALRVVVSIALVVASVNLWRIAGRDCASPTIDLALGAAVAACLALWTRDDRSWGRRMLSCRPLPTLGVFAYSLYLIHAPFVQFAWTLTARPLGLSGLPGFALLLVTAVPLCIGVAYVFFLACERPYLPGRTRTSARDKMVTAVEPAAP